MNRQRVRVPILLLAILVCGSLGGCFDTSPSGPGDVHARLEPAAAVQRPVADFLSAQGTTSLFFPPAPDYIGWANNNPQSRFALIDYAGLAADYLRANGGPSIDTQVSGTVSERELADGRAEVIVALHTSKALSWAVGLPGDITSDPLQFGYRVSDLIADPTLQPALSLCEFRVVFKNDAPGAALPDIVNAFVLGNTTPGQELISLMFRSQGKGTLHAPFGVEGAPGSLTVSQTGIFMTSFQGGTADGFPAERVDLRPIGGGVVSP